MRLKQTFVWACACVAVGVPVAVVGADAGAATMAPTVSTGGVKALTATSATLTGTVNPNGQATTYFFQYGTTTSYGSQAPSPPGNAGAGNKKFNASAAVSSLAPSTTYHYRLVATNASGTTDGADHTFKTKAAPPPPAPGVPIVSTGAAMAVTTSTATLTGTVNPNGEATTYHFQYGTSTAYGSVAPSVPASAGAGTKNVNAAAAIGSLAPNTTYHYRLVATNASGTTLGADRTFKTANPSVTIAAVPSTIVFGQTTTLAGSVNGGPPTATVTLQRSGSATGPFVNVAATTPAKRGAYSFPGQKPSSNTYYRVLFNNKTSVPVLVHVRFSVSFFVSNTNPRRGRLIRYSGRVGPSHNGFRVQIQRLGSDHVWHTIARIRLHAALGNASAYSIRLSARRGGLYRAMVKPDAHHARGFSRVIRISLR